MKCIYCMPYNNSNWFHQEDIMDFDEILKIASILAKLGIKKIRLTGGEPLTRPHLEILVGKLSKIEEIESISLTTNGLLLAKAAKKLKESGLESVNISLDTFDPKIFEKITGINGLRRVFDGINIAQNAGLKIKINTVIIRGWNQNEIVNFAKFSRKTGYPVRFIEFMPLDGTGIWRPDLVVSKKEMISALEQNIQKLEPLNNDLHEPAELYSFVDGKGIIGFIPSMTEPFCKTCDRIRITSDGKLLTCLFEKNGFDLRKLLRDKSSDQEIIDNILQSMKKKSEGIIKIIRTNSIKPTLNLMHTIGG